MPVTNTSGFERSKLRRNSKGIVEENLEQGSFNLSDAVLPGNAMLLLVRSSPGKQEVHTKPGRGN